MAYIGRGTDSISNVEVLDNITFSGASSYTLQKGSANYVPISAANILVSIDGVVQANNFSVNGSTIDFGVAIANTSTCNFILHYGVGLVTTVQDGAITSTKLGSSSVTSAKMASNSIATASIIDDAVNYAKMQDVSQNNRLLGAETAGTIAELQVNTDMIADAQVDESKLKISNAPTNGYFLSAQSGGSGGMTWAEAGGTNTPAFQVTLSANQSIANNDQITKITFDTEAIDTNGKFASNRFTPTVAGTYFISLTASVASDSAGTVNLVNSKIYKNGSQIPGADSRIDFRGNSGRGASPTANALVVLDTDDYIEGYSSLNASSGTCEIRYLESIMSGFKLIT